MSSVKENLEKVHRMICDTALSCGRKPEDVLLIAVTKKKNINDIRQAMNAGVGHFGENYIQEAMEKIDILGKDRACWHFIGHLQSNKARFAVRYFEYIHAVDSFKLAKEINKQAESIHKIQKILVQINISNENTKSGADADNAVDLVRQIHSFKNISLQGLMCMPPYVEDPEEARPYFKGLCQIRETITAKRFQNVFMDHLSMGMSHDFKIAVEEGATMVRIGTALFGERI